MFPQTAPLLPGCSSRPLRCCTRVFQQTAKSQRTWTTRLVAAGARARLFVHERRRQHDFGAKGLVKASKHRSASGRARARDRMESSRSGRGGPVLRCLPRIFATETYCRRRTSTGAEARAPAAARRCCWTRRRQLALPRARVASGLCLAISSFVLVGLVQQIAAVVKCQRFSRRENRFAPNDLCCDRIIEIGRTVEARAF